MGPLHFALLVLGQPFIGMLIGSTAQLVFTGVQLGGTLINQQMGLGLANIFDPQNAQQTSIVANFQYILVVILFFSMQAHHGFIYTMAESLHAIPLLDFAESKGVIQHLLELLSRTFIMAIKLSAPIIVSLLLANMAMGIVARLVPQMNIFVLSFPVNFGVGLMILGFALPTFLTGFLILVEAIEPKWSHLNPLEGFKRIFSVQSRNELFKSLVKIGLVGYIAYATIAADFAQLFPMSQQAVEDVLRFLGHTTLRIGIHISYALIALAALDYGFQRWQYKKSLKMTIHGVKQERKKSECDLQIRDRIRSMMGDMAWKRTIEEVPKADAVVTNPTHLAVALHCRRQEMPAPTVIAKGAGYIAERIREIAQKHQFPKVVDELVPIKTLGVVRI